MHRPGGASGGLAEVAPGPRRVPVDDLELVHLLGGRLHARRVRCGRLRAPRRGTRAAGLRWGPIGGGVVGAGAGPLWAGLVVELTLDVHHLRVFGIAVSVPVALTALAPRLVDLMFLGPRVVPPHCRLHRPGGASGGLAEVAPGPRRVPADDLELLHLLRPSRVLGPLPPLGLLGGARHHAGALEGLQAVQERLELLEAGARGQPGVPRGVLVDARLHGPGHLVVADLVLDCRAAPFLLWRNPAGLGAHGGERIQLVQKFLEVLKCGRVLVQSRIPPSVLRDAFRHGPAYLLVALFARDGGVAFVLGLCHLAYHQLYGAYAGRQEQSCAYQLRPKCHCCGDAGQNL
mmetsp:Transcript_30370/g.85145  ORF Transcript_30370/g.85145 Transcript_30370/m.85145 type:complete len:346 (+) Transcript_30370:23-1060(+)